MRIAINNSTQMQYDEPDSTLSDPGELTWTFKSFYSDHCLVDKFLPNQLSFYNIMFIRSGKGSVTIGGNIYHVESPVILFVHPNESISWKNLSIRSGAYYALFKEAFLIRHPQFKAMLNKFGLFNDKSKSVIYLNDSEVNFFCQYFERIQVEETLNSVYREDTILAMLQLLVVESIKAAHFLKMDSLSVEYSHTDKFFELLEKEILGISFTNPIRIKTAKEFAASLHMHPNHLNVLLKKKTGQNLSTHIRNRLVEEAKTLLLDTNWNLQDIAYCIGFSEQSNFSLFFKKNTGFTPAEFRRVL